MRIFYDEEKAIHVLNYIRNGLGSKTESLKKINYIIFQANNFHMAHYERPVLPGTFFVTEDNIVTIEEIQELIVSELPKEPELPNLDYLSTTDINSIQEAFLSLDYYPILF